MGILKSGQSANHRARVTDKQEAKAWFHAMGYEFLFSYENGYLVVRWYQP